MAYEIRAGFKGLKTGSINPTFSKKKVFLAFGTKKEAKIIAKKCIDLNPKVDIEIHSI